MRIDKVQSLWETTTTQYIKTLEQKY
jgi:hypothetical protein